MDKRELSVAKGSIFSEILMLGISLVPKVVVEAIFDRRRLVKFNWLSIVDTPGSIVSFTAVIVTDVL